MSYLKRIASPRTWVTPRKGTKYLTSPYPGKLRELSMPLNLVIRDLLKLASTRKEVKIMLNQKDVLINGRVVNNEKFPVGILDIVTIPKIKKSYNIYINEKKKFDAEEMKENTKSQVYKVVNKTVLPKNKVQLNLFNGRNVLHEDKKVKVNDSVVLDLEKGKILKHLPIKEGAKVYVIGGTHLGSNGVVNKIKDNEVNVKIGSNSFDLKVRNVYVTA